MQQTHAMKNAILLLLIFFTLTVKAQSDSIIESNPKTETPKFKPFSNYKMGKGILLSSNTDSTFQLKVRARMQNRLTYYVNDGEANELDPQIRRLRLRFEGFIGNPKFEYNVQFGFATNDIGLVPEKKYINIIRDVMLYYKPNKNWKFGLGQTKLPGNRERINSSGALQLTDRSINNAEFNLDRDLGIQAQYQHLLKDKFSYVLAGAISTGEGRNKFKFNDLGLAYTGKLELLPFGTFKNEGQYFEGDLAREVNPKLMISAAYSYNHKASRTKGQMGYDLYTPTNIKSLFLDAIFKYKGWAFMYAYLNRNADEIFTYNPNNLAAMQYVYVGYGQDFQASYTFKNQYEIVGRFSHQKVDKNIFQFKPNTNQWSLGLNKYFYGHALKLQLEETYEQLKYFNANAKNNWYTRFQIEIAL